MQEGNNGVALTDAAAKARVWDIVTEHDLYNMVGGSAYQLDSGNDLPPYTGRMRPLLVVVERRYAYH